MAVIGWAVAMIGIMGFYLGVAFFAVRPLHSCRTQQALGLSKRPRPLVVRGLSNFRLTYAVARR
jgi:hypothetical protein